MLVDELVKGLQAWLSFRLMSWSRDFRLCLAVRAPGFVNCFVSSKVL